MNTVCRNVDRETIKQQNHQKTKQKESEWIILDLYLESLEIQYYWLLRATSSPLTLSYLPSDIWRHHKNNQDIESTIVVHSRKMRNLPQISDKQTHSKNPRRKLAFLSVIEDVNLTMSLKCKHPRRNRSYTISMTKNKTGVAKAPLPNLVHSHHKDHLSRTKTNPKRLLHKY